MTLFVDNSITDFILLVFGEHAILHHEYLKQGLSGEHGHQESNEIVVGEPLRIIIQGDSFQCADTRSL